MKVVAIQVKGKREANKLGLIKKVFTVNKSYLGHTKDGIPVYKNKNLKKNEIIEIMG